MITAPIAARLGTPSPRTPLPAPLRLRSAHHGDATALEALSRPFVRSGALRERSLSLYASDAADFLVVEAQDGALDGCLGLRVHPAEPSRGRGPAGVLYNFCVAPQSQGSGVGAQLLRGALAHATAQSLDVVFTATTGGGGLFLRYGFASASEELAPMAWVKSLDPRRNSRVLARAL
ncbi:GNAT family N-acetyltransferase [Streptomyces sp. H27-C3]|uniref:GNAT family N-acetyltransferase n=1 Tax=Streptomyces sp. H27-C3 TaxID=3046305 RepID=UPI0024BBCEA6|nr:GNAT family N-acetyltransferase [Streptomyces sp. H27-C3]MDJ0463944.1 GNAT family N-acetyltransferase [Streptomyces sp. H27-C3]